MADTLDELHPNSLAARDYAAQQDVGDLKQLLSDVLASTDRSSAQMNNEIAQAEKWPGRLNTLEYLTFRLYERDRSERKEYISDRLHWPIHEYCSDDVWSPKTVDKWECTKALIDAGAPTIPVSAMVDRSGRSYGDTVTISSGSELTDYLRGAALPLFAKPNQLLGSFGAFRIEAIDGDVVTLNGNEQVRADVMIDELMSGVPYVLQEVVNNHPSIRAFAAGLATIRTVNFVSADSVHMAAAVFKIPVGDNIADNFWRDGNLIADIDPQSGVIRRAVTGSGPYQVEHQVHPDTGDDLVGFEVPLWAEVLELNRRSAEVFSAISYQSQDIAISDDGPVVVEVNSGGSFALPQVASGRGFLTKENKKFFESCGVNFRKL